VACTLLGFFVSPWLFAVPAFLGVGPITAGLTEAKRMKQVGRRS
jgi:hypothetical protein